MTPRDAKEAEASALAETAASDPTVSPALAGTVATDSHERPVSSTDGPLRPFGPFTRVERLTEQGAMGVVARGYNGGFDRWELLKFLNPILSTQPEFVRQFFREGRVLAKLSHPNIVQVFAIYALDGRPCLAMEFLEGVSLAGHVAKERSPIARWHELFLAAARGLAAAHDVGLLHRDIKPENLFVVHDRSGAPKGLKLIDFGLATADRSRRADPTHDPTLVADMGGGTPLYMAPELWRGEDASPRTDVYSLGQSFFFALTGRLPFVAETVAQVCITVCSEEPFPDARELRPDLPAPLALVLRRAIAKRKEERIATADELVAALVAAASAARPRRVPGSGPYRGLGSYSPAERDVFFGRDTEVAEVLEHLRSQSGVVLVGPSGSGKSSLAQAGVMPAIEEGALGGGIAYSSVLLEPRARPLQSLAAALARRLGSVENDVLAFLRTTPARLGESLRAALPPEAGVVLIIDQFEEIATIAEDPAEVRSFAAAVASLIEVGAAPVRVVATLRADLMDRLFALEPLRPLLTRGFYPVRPMGSDALRQAMTGPALAADYRLEDPRIVDRVVEDVARTPSGLPLLSFAMAAWWEARDEATRTLPTAAWASLGGLTGALTRHGDRALETMGEDSRRVAEQILVRLVSADRTRTRISRALLLDPAAAGPGAALVLERLLTAKLVHESSGELELVHEALITQWPRLRDLIASSGEDRAFRERVGAAAREWEAQRRPDGALWTGEQAMRLDRWFMATGASLDQLELAFIEAVRRRARRSRVISRALVAAAVLVALSYGLVAKSHEREIRKRLDATSAKLTETKTAYVQAETGRLNDLAAFEMMHNPGAALRHAAESYELDHDATLDAMAWNARAQGVGVLLPGLKGAVSSVQMGAYPSWIAAAGGGVFQALATASSKHRTQSIGAGQATVLAFDGQTLALGTGTGTILAGEAPQRFREAKPNPGDPVWEGETPAFAMTEVGRCEGAVRQIEPHFFAVCQPESGPPRLVRWDSLRDAARPNPLAAMFPGINDITALDVSPSGDTALVGEQSGAVASLSLASASNTKPTLLGRAAGAVLRVGRGPHGETVVIDSTRMAEVRVDGLAQPLGSEVGSRAFAWVPRRNAVALVGRAGEVLVISLATLEVIGKMPSPGHEITSLAADPQGEWLVAGASDGALQAFNLDQGTVAITQGPVRPAPSACGLSPDGAAVACVSSGASVVRTVEGSGGVQRPPARLTLATETAALALGPAGSPVFSLAGGELNRDGRAAPRLLQSASLVATSDTRIVVAGSSPEGRPALVVAPLSLESPLPPTVLAAPAIAVGWAGNGSRLLVATADRKVRILQPSPSGMNEVSSLDVPASEAVTALAGSDDGKRVVVGTSAGTVLLGLAAGGSLRKLAELHAPVACLAVGRAGRAIVASADRRASVIDGDTTLSFMLWATSSPVARCARSPGEDRFSFVNQDGTTWLRALDLAGVTESYVPADPAQPPTLDGWKGLPVGLVR